MKAAEMILKLLNKLFSFALASMLLVAASFSGYVLWDEHEVTESARAVQRSIQTCRPAEPGTGETASPASFEQLQALNPDICAWLSLSDTKIDYPVVQGRMNGEYLSKDVYGGYALAGSIFLDARNSRQFEDAILLVSGHNVSSGEMFADLVKFEDADFFEKNGEGLLQTPERAWKLNVFAVLHAPAKEELIFDPEFAAENRSLLLDYVEKHALQMESEILTAFQTGDGKILVMTTCVNGPDEDKRRIVLAGMEDMR